MAPTRLLSFERHNRRERSETYPKIEAKKRNVSTRAPITNAALTPGDILWLAAQNAKYEWRMAQMKIGRSPVISYHNAIERIAEKIIPSTAMTMTPKRTGIQQQNLVLPKKTSR
jgi:hypothetical protein